MDKNNKVYTRMAKREGERKKLNCILMVVQSISVTKI
jgi:hypothetical protein